MTTDAVAAQIERLGPWFHDLRLPSGHRTAPDHWLGDFPMCKWRRSRRASPRTSTGRAHEVERELRIAQVVQQAEEEHDVEAFVDAGEVVDRHLAELDAAAGVELLQRRLLRVPARRARRGGAGPAHEIYVGEPAADDPARFYREPELRAATRQSSRFSSQRK